MNSPCLYCIPHVYIVFPMFILYSPCLYCIPHVYIVFPMFILYSPCLFCIPHVYIVFPMFILYSPCLYCIPHVYIVFPMFIVSFMFVIVCGLSVWKRICAGLLSFGYIICIYIGDPIIMRALSPLNRFNSAISVVPVQNRDLDFKVCLSVT
jgi:hypothetical protein